jgi:nucleoside-diphosphate-sugar epimerase
MILPKDVHSVPANYSQIYITSIRNMTTEPTPAFPPGSWVLVTGATGHIASHVTSQLLQRGYKVRGTVRDLTSASWLVDDLFKHAAVAGNFELVLVSNFGDPDAFKDAVRGVSAIAHIATPNNFDPDPSKVIPVTVVATTSILKAAVSEPSVQRFVYTSSVAAAATQRPGNHTHVGRDTWNDWAIEIANAPPPYEASRGPAVYSAAKVMAEKAVWKFLEEEQPPIAINVISPFATIGPVLHPNQSGATSMWIKELLKGDLSSTKIVPNCKSSNPYFLFKIFDS